MIGKLKGLIDGIAEDHVILDVGGVGYVAFCSGQTLRALPGTGEAATLLIETHVREDHIHLYGFAEASEREWFTTLTTVKGVGTKMALAILSALTPAQVATAIAAQDKAAFTQVSGVGPRLAERLLTELKNKVDTIATDAVVPIQAAASGKATEGEAPSVADAISALTNLGYNRSEAYGAVHRIAASSPELELDDLIRLGLKELAG